MSCNKRSSHSSGGTAAFWDEVNKCRDASVRNHWTNTGETCICSNEHFQIRSEEQDANRWDEARLRRLSKCCPSYELRANVVQKITTTKVASAAALEAWLEPSVLTNHGKAGDLSFFSTG